MNKVWSEGLHTQECPHWEGTFRVPSSLGMQSQCQHQYLGNKPTTVFGVQGELSSLAIDISHKPMAAETNISELRVLPGIDSALHRCTMRNWHVWSILCDVYSWVGCRCCEFGAFRFYSSSLFSQKQIFVMINRKKKNLVSFHFFPSFPTLSCHSRRKTRRYVSGIKLNLSSTKAGKVMKCKRKYNLMWLQKKSKTNENCLQLASRSQHPFREEKMCHLRQRYKWLRILPTEDMTQTWIIFIVCCIYSHNHKLILCSHFLLS